MKKIFGKFFIILLLGLFVLGSFFVSSNLKNNKEVNAGRGQDSPEIFIDATENGRSRGGVILLTSFDEPSVELSVYGGEGKTHMNIYKAGVDNLLNYLLHDEKNNQLDSKVDTSKLEFITSIEESLERSAGYWSNGKRVLLPIDGEGIYVLEVKFDNISFYSFVVVSNFAVLAKEGKDEFIFWAQNLETKKSLTSGVLKVYDLKNEKKLLAEAVLNGEGIVKTKMSRESDLAVIENNGIYSFLFLNLRYLNTNHRHERYIENEKKINFFLFTDRPIYMPGDTVYFKAVLRDDLDNVYSIPKGKVEMVAQLSWPDRSVIDKQEITISKEGTVDGKLTLPKDAKMGKYSIALTIKGETGSVSKYFQVEYYRKPEYFVDVSLDKDVLASDESLKFKIKGNYFSGHPLVGKVATYSIQKRKYYDPSFLKDFNVNNRYWGYYGSEVVFEGKATFDKNGVALVEIPAEKRSVVPELYIIEAKYIDETQNQVIAKKNALVYGSKFGIYREGNYKSYNEGDNIDVNLILKAFSENTSLEGRELKIKAKREKWYRKEGGYWNWGIEKEDVVDKTIKTDKEGKIPLKIENAKAGSYTIYVITTNDSGLLMTKNFHLWVRGKNSYYYDPNTSEEMELNMTTDKEEYKPGEKAKLTIVSKDQDRDVFFSIEKEWIKDYQIVRLENGEAKIEVPILNEYLSNASFNVSSFSNVDLETNYKAFSVSAEDYQLDVKVKSDKEEYGPGDTVRLDVSTFDTQEKGVVADVALFVVDKALYELAPDSTGDIFYNFWKERWGYTNTSHSLEGLVNTAAEKGGCFAGDTKVLMVNGEKQIKDVKVGEKVLTFVDKTQNKLIEAEVKNIHKAKVPGYIIVNEKLRITPNHILLVNNDWKEVGIIQIGDILKGSNGEEIIVKSLEWQKGETEVYNLEISELHTFIANGIFVHNDKGGGERSVFEDAAYWNPSVKTGRDGKASVTFTLPDNLTTWAFVAVAATSDTKVGQAKGELVVTKDVVVRPVFPNIFRTGDKIMASAMVHNFTLEDREFEVKMEFDSGKIASATQDVFIKSKGFTQIFWPIFPDQENENAKFRVSALDKENDEIGDIVIHKMPIIEFGFWQNHSFAGVGNQKYEFKLATTSISEKTNIKLTMSLSAIGPVESAMNYLVKYPYGCIEQTTSRFVPVVLALENKDLLRKIIGAKDLNDMINSGVKRLKRFQNSDGGWSWWYSDNSEPYLSLYVLEYLIKAKDAGAKFDYEVLEKAKKFFDRENFVENNNDEPKDALACQSYALTLFDSEYDSKEIKDFENMSPDILSLATLANIRNGYAESGKKAIEKLKELATFEKDNVFWTGGSTDYYGSRDASTAMALRVFIESGTDEDIVKKGINYLLTNRRNDYWSNTYGTVKVLRTMIDHLNKNELDKENKYIVRLDDQEIAKGKISRNNQIAEIEISPSDIKPEGSSISISQESTSDIYSTLVAKEFNLNPEAKAIDSGFQINRIYTNQHGGDHLGVGDIVTITFDVQGIDQAEGQIVIEDHLPAGMVPVNENLANEDSQGYYWRWYGDKDYTKDGVNVYLRYLSDQSQVYSYEARVVSSGIFKTPPAKISLMYRPEKNGMSDASIVELDDEGSYLTEAEKRAERQKVKIYENSTWNKKQKLMFILKFAVAVVPAIIVITLLAFYSFVMIKKKKTQAGQAPQAEQEIKKENKKKENENK